LIGGFACLTFLSGGAKVQGNKTVAAQPDDPILNNTDYNVTIGQISPNLNVTIVPRIVTEYGDYASTQSLNPNIPPLQISPRIIMEYPDGGFQLALQSPQGLNVTGVTPRIIIEYADYASFIGLPLQAYSGPDVPLQTLNITDVIQNPLATNVTATDVVSVNATVTDSVSTVTQVSLNFTSGNGTWITANMTNLQGNIWNSTIPAFPNGTKITYIVAATDSTGNTVTTQQLGYTLQYTVVPEFAALPIVFLFLMATLLAVLIRTRKRPRMFAT
jgi:hypothetical protein